MIKDVIKTIQADSACHELYDAADEHEIGMTENALKVKLPESFRCFLKNVSNGAYLYMTQEVSAVGRGNQQIAPIQTLDVKKLIYKDDVEEWVPIRGGGRVRLHQLIPFSLDSNGNAWCFIAEDSIRGNEYRVAYLDCHNPKLYGLMGHFTAWLQTLMEGKMEVIRYIYDDDVIVEELELG